MVRCTSKIISIRLFLTSVSILILSMAAFLELYADPMHRFWTYLRNSFSSGTFIMALSKQALTRKSRFARFHSSITRTNLQENGLCPWSPNECSPRPSPEIPTPSEEHGRMNRERKRIHVLWSCPVFQNQTHRLWSWGRSHRSPLTWPDRQSTARMHPLCLNIWITTEPPRV